MQHESCIVFSGIVPHPPIMVPEVGRDSITEVHESIEAMTDLTKRVIVSGAKTLILVSPHAPLKLDAFVAYVDQPLRGDFANFREPEAQVEAPLDVELFEAIVNIAAGENYDVLGLRDQDLDHGTTVPLYFLQHNGWRGSVVALGYSFLSSEDHLRFGSCLKQAAEIVGRPVALIASGDLSHRLKPHAPAGYNPRAYIFDEEVVGALRGNTPGRIVNMDQDLRRLAGECGYRSMLVALGATSELPQACEVLSYQAPFGVGYLVAQLTNRNQRANGDLAAGVEEIPEAEDIQELPALARKAIEAYVLTGHQLETTACSSELLTMRAACFVSIKTKSGELRGCIGTVEPLKENLAEELIANAINAALRDPRFPPITANELPSLSYSVDVLGEPESVNFEELDPVLYGVIVEDEEGTRRGLLLPDIEGVDTATKQVEIAARKAGIPPGSPLKLSRFRVSRFREKPTDPLLAPED